MSKFRRFGRLLAATTVSATIVVGAPVAFAQEDNVVDFSVTNITDFHGHLSTQETDAPDANSEMGAAKLKALIEYVNQDQEYIMTTSGDNVGGSAFVSAIADDEPTLDVLNMLGVDVSAVGNHEFDRGYDDLLGRIAEKSDYPLLGANVTLNGEPMLDASYVQEIDGVKVGFVGTVTTLTKNKVAPSAVEGVEFSDPVEATNKEADRLKESGEADVVVALMHEDAQQYAAGFNNNVDILFGGDSHQRSQGIIERDAAQPLHWAQGHEYGKVLQDADISFNKDTREIESVEITQYDRSMPEVEALAPDAEVAARVAAAEAEAEELGAEVVGQMDRATFRGQDEGAGAGSNRGVESTLNSLIADANRASVAKSTGVDVDLGIMNAGGVRADLPNGDVTFQDVLTVQPFGNSIAYGTLTGQDILDALEAQWQPGSSRPRLALGLSAGFEYAYDPAAEQGQRVISATLNGEELDPSTEYTVATSTFLFDGGDNFASLANVQNLTDVGYMDYSVLNDYIADGAEVQEGQSDIGISTEGTMAAGEEVTFNLTSLNYTMAEDPQATTATVAVGDVQETADIDTAWNAEEDAQKNEFGRASVTLTLPEDIEPTDLVTVTTDAGTEISVPLSALGANEGAAGGSKPSSSAPDTGKGSSQGASAAVGIAGVLAAIAGIAAFIGLNGQFDQFIPANMQRALNDLRRQLNEVSPIKF
ncbi:bifunctional UDP-sugar hydrolase/5'-nucleotidase [Corynebacterium sp. J010B-136]|uniref:bifunctional metallophosphatase/5'-nucleotidase n=1 Tax=Corynebacterium sp. J010B-136 TaxID=2099401 RepID=UPI000CF9DD70|nr:bifunctional UDP-sugar hydrolase/5'-nucleotidase [Corynebacterium sp. J010B-136]PQM74674.1 bifunctional metallophosphatase/5'-nucleotidase [Corynebacterium sp. J010B-136]